MLRGDKVTPCETTAAVTALANAIACKMESSEQLAVLAAVYVQLGDTLATIAATRALCEKNSDEKRGKNKCC